MELLESTDGIDGIKCSFAVQAPTNLFLEHELNRLILISGGGTTNQTQKLMRIGSGQTEAVNAEW